MIMAALRTVAVLGTVIAALRPVIGVSIVATLGPVAVFRAVVAALRTVAVLAAGSILAASFSLVLTPGSLVVIAAGLVMSFPAISALGTVPVGAVLTA